MKIDTILKKYLTHFNFSIVNALDSIISLINLNNGDFL